ncbi:hypothetical protein [Couchioplanes caeruleus]|uniref:Uncharacterized protein n=2 Tax=Couchioplanes caeruleus TaxID=56438 RepID=A0A1K0GHY5_9ACTN|nr:hypothetical protein [Couchioplanes caeruleus]OJF11846.1 hypothetical protein BG844_23915 [Couchioplanes caeruleus subsp. caeruleus]ROP29597.1 hypothetical protein EDD30_2398 [Couchioplanes caeruleus]
MTQHRHTRKRSPILWVFLAVLIVAVGVVLVPKMLLNGEGDDPAPVAASEADPMLTVIDKCDPAKQGLKLSDKNRKLTVDGYGKTTIAGLHEQAMTCVMETLQMPGALTDRMYSTVPDDGRLAGEWPGYTVTWTNDPEEGLDLTITRIG